MLSKQFEGIEPDFKLKFQRYLKKCEALYNDTVDHVIKQNFDNLLDVALAVNKINKVHAPVIFRTFWQQVNKYSEMKWTMGYLTFYIGIDKKLPDIEHHNYFLGSNYEDYSRVIMSDVSRSEKPYYYVNVISKHNASCAPEGCEALFFVCPIPNLLYKEDWSDRDEIIDDIIEDFSKRMGLDIKSHVVFREAFTPEDWQNKFNLYKGAGLGLSHNILQIGGFRPSNVDEEFKNVFYVGASTVPGAGLPMAVISSKLV